MENRQYKNLIIVPKEMTLYVNSRNKKEELERNEMILYLYIKNLTISHGRAAEILGIRKADSIADFEQAAGLVQM